MNETIQSVVGMIMIIVIFVPAGGILFTLWRSGGLNKIIEDDVPRKRIEALNHLADAIEHLASSMERNELIP